MDKSFYFVLPLNEDAHRAMYGLENYLSHDADPNSETVNFDCAVIVFPTGKQIQYYKDMLKEDFYESVKSNNEYYDMVKEVIESAGVKTTSTRGEYLRMIGTNMTWNLILRKDYLPPWNLIFFTRDHGPKIVPPSEFGTELITTYFGVG
jgi:hypothetical protein